MKSFFKETFKEIIVTVVSSSIMSLLAVFGIKLLELKLEITIDPKITRYLLIAIILIALLNFMRLVKRKKIDNLQEFYYPFGVISNPDMILTQQNLQVLYRIDVQVKNSYYKNAFEGTEKQYTVLYVEGPLCPQCESEIKQTRLFWGKYKHFCPRDHVSFKNKFNNFTMSEHTKTDVNKELRENGLKKLNN